MPNPPQALHTFLFTDIEGSTRLWEQHPQAMGAALAQHDAILRTAIAAQGGTVFKTIGDAFCAAFPAPAPALQAALDAQRALQKVDWGPLGEVRVRMALHTGEAEARADDYFGPTLNRVARLLQAAHGGQVLCSTATQLALSQTTLALRDLGEHRLKDLNLPERIYQILAPDLPQNFPPLRSLAAFSHNLPPTLTSFIGRERELAALKEQLATTPLLTLTGVGGTGKTRLALHLAADLLESFPDGVWLVELAPLTEPLVAHTVANVLGLRNESERPHTEVIADYLRGRQTLLILDNCEHVIQAAARFAAHLLRACPQVKLLATSREALGIAGETPFHVPSLSLPTNSGALPPAQLLDYEAVRLFVERAQAAQPRFALTETNAAAVAQICARLDGIPLALELAAARVRALPVEQIAARLNDRFRLLTGGSRTALPRQQTLQAMIDWSYELLTAPEKTLLQRLAVFAGGWSLEAAEEVAGDGATAPPTGLPTSEVLDALTRLVDKSLVLLEDTAHGPRYRMLETVRQYAREKLLRAGDVETIRTRHRDHLAQWGARAAPALVRHDQKIWLAQVDAELDNIRGALEWSLTAEGETEEEMAAHLETGMTLLGDLAQFWQVRGHWTEAREWATRFLQHPGSHRPTMARVAALTVAATLADHQAAHTVAHPWWDELLTLSRQLSYPPGQMRALVGLTYALLRESNDHALTEAQKRFEETVALGQQTNDLLARLIAYGQYGAFLAFWKYDYPAAQVAFETNLQLCRQLGHALGVAGTLLALGAVQMVQHHLDAGAQYYQEAIAIYREFGDKSGLAQALRGLASCRLEQQDWALADQYYTESLSLARELGDIYGVINTYLQWGEAERAQGRLAAARTHYLESLRLSREHQMPETENTNLHNLGYVALEEGQLAAARAYFVACEQQARALERPILRGLCLGGFAWVAAHAGQLTQAARWLGAMDGYLEQRHYIIASADAPVMERYWAALLAQGEATSLTATRVAARTLPFEAAMAEALATNFD